jgi:hypothetical protein
MNVKESPTALHNQNGGIFILYITEVKNLRFSKKRVYFVKKLKMQKNQSVFNNYFSLSKTPQYLLIMFLLAFTLPACKVKSGCTGAQKAAYTNSMDTKKRGKTSLFSKSMKKKMKIK